MTYLSNYSPQIVPGGDTSRYFSVLTETSYSKFKPLPKGDFGKAVVDGLVAEGILQPSDLPLIETVFLIHAGHSYPIPSTDRNPALDTIQAYLELEGDLLARPLRLLEVRDRQPGSLAHAGRRARRPLAGRKRGEGLPELKASQFLEALVACGNHRVPSGRTTRQRRRWRLHAKALGLHFA